MKRNTLTLHFLLVSRKKKPVTQNCQVDAGLLFKSFFTVPGFNTEKQPHSYASDLTVSVLQDSLIEALISEICFNGTCLCLTEVEEFSDTLPIFRQKYKQKNSGKIIKGYTNVTRTDSDPNLHQQLCKAFDNAIHVRTKNRTGCYQIACW